LNKNSRRTN